VHRYPEPVRAVLIVNPSATSTNQLRQDVIAHALASQMDLEVVETRYRGHAATLARTAASDGYQLVLTLGGDGTVNEAINGLLRGPATPASTGPATTGPTSAASASTDQASTDQASTGQASTGQASTGQASTDHAGRTPAFGALPGGQANVFTRALGLPTDPVDATGRVIEALQAGQHRSVGLGCVQFEGAGPGRPAGRYFTFNAGLGLDAEVVRAIEGLRAHGRTVTPRLYLRTAVRQFYRVTDRRHPALTLERDGQPPVGPLFFSIISNTSPWTYLGARPVNPSPGADFDLGLDVFGLRRMRTVGTLSALRQMMAPRNEPLRGRHVVSLHDQRAFTISAGRPVALQVDGEYVGEYESVTFHSVPDALRVIA
jgi:diacylglycerol kinase family enzyme